MGRYPRVLRFTYGATIKAGVGQGCVGRGSIQGVGLNLVYLSRDMVYINCNRGGVTHRRVTINFRGSRSSIYTLFVPGLMRLFMILS